MSLRIEVLSPKHRRLVSAFENQHRSLTTYLQRFALRHATKDLLARTYVAIDEGSRGPRVAGYFSLCAASVERSSVVRIPTLARLPRFPIPAILLARLAVDTRAQGQGLGRFLFDSALALTLELAIAGPLAFRVLVTDAIDDAAARFYEHFGLVRLDGAFPSRMVLDLRPLLPER